MHKGIIFFIFSSFFLVLLLSLNLVSSVVLCNSKLPGGCPKEITTTTSATNYSLVNVNNSQYLGGIPGSGYIRTDGSSTTTAQIPFAVGIHSEGDSQFEGDTYHNQSIYFGTDEDFRFIYDSVAGLFRFSQGSTLGGILTVNENTGLINIYYPINSSKGINSTGKICDSVGCITVGAGTGNCPAGQVVQNTTTGGVQCVDRVDPSTTYYVNATSVTGGTITSTQINDTYWYDGITYNVSEGGGVAPLTLYLNYTNVTTFSQWILREYYLGSASHNLQFEIYDYTSATWQSYFSVVGQTGQTWITLPIFDASEHISGGIVQTRIRHIETGITSHRLYIDVAWLVNGGNIGASTNLDGYAKYLFGFNNFAGNGTFTTSQNVTANIFYGNGSQLTGVVKTESDPIAKDFHNWINYNANTSQTSSGFNYSVQTMSFLNNGLVSWWRMDDTNSTGTLVQDYMNRNNGTAVGGASQVANGKFGKAWGFDGVDDYVNISTIFPTSNLAISCLSAWFNTKTTVGYHTIVGQQLGGAGTNGWSISYTPAETKIFAGAYNGGQASFSTATLGIITNNWYHVVGCQNETNTTLYFNGILKATGGKSTAITYVSFYIGKNDAAGWTNWNGSIDEVMIFNRSLSASEIQALYNSSQYNLYKNQTNLNQSLNYTMYVQNTDPTIITCLDNQCPATGGEVITTNATLHFNNTVLFAKDFVVQSRLYSGDALELIKGIKVKSTNLDGFQDIDYSKSATNIKDNLAFSTILKAIIQLITRIETSETTIINLQTENQRIKDCVSSSYDFKIYKECLLK